MSTGRKYFQRNSGLSPIWL